MSNVIIKKAKPAKNGKQRFYVVIKARNGRILSTSEVLNSKQAAITNINSLIRVMKKPFTVTEK